MTLMETLMVVAISSASALMTFTVISIAKPSSRKEMGVRLPGDQDLGKDEDNGYTKPDLDADTF